MRHVQHRSLESLFKRDHFHKEPPLNLQGTTGARGGRKGPVPKGTDLEIRLRLNVRFGSKADMCSALADVRYGPKADILIGRLWPQEETPDVARRFDCVRS
jgi:hypothetical protein